MEPMVIMLLQGEEKNRRLWKMGVVVKLISGKDGVVRGAVLKIGSGRKERPLQHLYPLELSCGSTKSHAYMHAAIEAKAVLMSHLTFQRKHQFFFNLTLLRAFIYRLKLNLHVHMSQYLNKNILIRNKWHYKLGLKIFKKTVPVEAVYFALHNIFL
jgi:hypothetical protein